MSQSPPENSHSCAGGHGSPARRRWAMWLIVANTAGAIQMTEPSIQGRSRVVAGTRRRYRGRAAGAIVGPAVPGRRGAAGGFIVAAQIDWHDARR